MRTHPGLLSIIVIVLHQCLLFHLIGNDFPPRAVEPQRYEAIAKRNPFGAPLVSKSPIPASDWARGLVLRGLCRIDGYYVAHIEDTSDAREWRTLRLVEGHDDTALTIRSVKPHRDPAQVEVIVERSDRAGDDQTATLTYPPSKPNPQKPSGERVLRPFNKNVSR